MADRCLPKNPKKRGWHWVRRYQGGPAIALFWVPRWHENGGKGWGSNSQPDREIKWEYLGPITPPPAKSNG